MSTEFLYHERNLVLMKDGNLINWIIINIYYTLARSWRLWEYEGGVSIISGGSGLSWSSGWQGLKEQDDVCCCRAAGWDICSNEIWQSINNSLKILKIHNVHNLMTETVHFPPISMAPSMSDSSKALTSRVSFPVFRASGLAGMI